MNLEQVKNLKHGDIVYHIEVKNADGSPARARINGKVKTWKRDIKRVQVPVKHGLYDHAYITEDNLDKFYQYEKGDTVLTGYGKAQIIAIINDQFTVNRLNVDYVVKLSELDQYN